MIPSQVLSIERWAVVPRHEAYRVSDIGRVARGDRMLRLPIDERGYRRVGVGGGVVRRVHILVAAAFLGPRPDGAVIRHLDGDSLNNCVENLKYGTPAENNLDVLRHGRHRSAARTHCPRAHPLEDPNLVPRTRKGHRNCLACNRAHNYLRVHPEADFKSVADRYYAEIVGGS